MYKFNFYAVTGMDKTLIECDSVELFDACGNMLELHPRRSDGEITLTASDRLKIEPVAANCASVCSYKRGTAGGENE